MPGGKDFRKWYAMRKALQDKGKWKHAVPAQEEGEPAPKQPREEEPQPESPDTPESLPPLEDPPTAEGRMSGFSILLWVREESSLLENLSGSTKTAMMKEMLDDAGCLLGVRWALDFTSHHLFGVDFIYALNTRFTVSEQTIKNALGDLYEHVNFIKGTQHATAEDLARYKAAKARWKVPDRVTESTTGWGAGEQAGTSLTSKRLRY